MNASLTTAAFDVSTESRNLESISYTLENLSSSPRLPVDLTLVMIEIRKKLGWTTELINSTLLEGIGEGSLNPVSGKLIALEGSIEAFVLADGTAATIRIHPSHTTIESINESEVRQMIESSTPFVPSMTDPTWTQPGLDDPFMRKDPQSQDPRSAEIGWPENYVMPEKYMRMGQEVNGDLWECVNLPDDPESMFMAMINAARETRVSIMGAIFQRFGRNLHGSLAISESDMELVVYPDDRFAQASFFTCGNSNPRPSLDYLHTAFDAAITHVRGFVRGRAVPFSYVGIAVRGGSGSTVWQGAVENDNELISA